MLFQKAAEPSKMATTINRTGSSNNRPISTPGKPQKAKADTIVSKEEEVEVMVHELEELRKKAPEGLDNLIFCKINFAMAVVTPKGKWPPLIC
jgi:predicted RNase H-like nuclease